MGPPLRRRARHGATGARVGECVLERRRIPVGHPLRHDVDAAVHVAAEDLVGARREVGELALQVHPPPVAAPVQLDQRALPAHRRGRQIRALQPLELESDQRRAGVRPRHGDRLGVAGALLPQE